jgi:hypothetical protein
MRPGVLLQVAKVRGELTRWMLHYQTEIRAESCPRHLECAKALCLELLEKMVRVQGYETQETRLLELRIEMMARTAEEMWRPAPELKKAKPRLSLVPPPSQNG